MQAYATEHERAHARLNAASKSHRLAAQIRRGILGDV